MNDNDSKDEYIEGVKEKKRKVKLRVKWKLSNLLFNYIVLIIFNNTII